MTPRLKKLTATLLAISVCSFGYIAYAAGAMAIDFGSRWVKGALYVGSSSQAATGNAMTKMLGGSATINFASTYSGVVLSSSITVTGAAAGDPCFVGVPTAAAALKAKFGCYVDAADSVKVWFSPEATTDGTAALVSGTPSQQTATVIASSLCTATPVGATKTIADKGLAVGVATTVLTVTGDDTVTTSFNYHCVAPVDPASGTYFVRVISSQ